VDAPIGFVAISCYGLAGGLFVDYGEAFQVHDRVGDPPVVRVITHISNEEEGIVTLNDDPGAQIHGLSDDPHDGWVEITDVEGMDAKDEAAAARFGASINVAGRWRMKCYEKTIRRDGKSVKVMDGYKMRIGDTRGFTPYKNGGLLTQVKVPFRQAYRRLAHAVLNPGEMMPADFAKWDAPQQMHVAFQVCTSSPLLGRNPLFSL
jgi:ubiquitin-activating enzyme E1